MSLILQPYHLTFIKNKGRSTFNFNAWDRKHYEEVAKVNHAIVRQTMMNVNTNRSNQHLEQEYLKAVLPYQIKTGILGEENNNKETIFFPPCIQFGAVIQAFGCILYQIQIKYNLASP